MQSLSRGILRTSHSWLDFAKKIESLEGYFTNIYLFIYTFCHKEQILQKEKEKRITKISNLQGRKSYNNSSTLNVVLSDLTFVKDRS